MVQDKSLLLSIGNTGCGKSTMMTSLMFGTKALEVKNKQSIITVTRNGKTSNKKQNRQIIEQKPDILQKNLFTIGHEDSKSCTFLPHLKLNEATGLIFADVAGLGDTAGNLVDIINCFIDKIILLKAKDVRFIIPLTRSQITEGRGSGTKEHIETVLNMCGTDLEDIVKAIQPLLLKMSPKDDEIDIELLRSTFCEQLMSSAKNKKKELEQECNQEEVESKIKSIEQFYQEISFNIEIFDPLDRDVPEDDNQAIKREDLLNVIKDMACVNGNLLNAPLSNKMMTLLEEHFDILNKQTTTKI